MKCRNCSNAVDGRWAFCPYCGAPVEREIFPLVGIFEEFAKEMGRMQKTMGASTPRLFEAFDLKPVVEARKPGASGFSISIKRASGQEPRVDVQTFGNVDVKQIESQLKNLGVQPGALVQVGSKGRAVSKPKPRTRAMPEVTEEPPTKIDKKGNLLKVEMELPGVKSESDIEIQRLPQSIEIRAYGEEKGYFKILSVTPTAKITKTAFRKGKLILEIEC